MTKLIAIPYDEQQFGFGESWFGSPEPMPFNHESFDQLVDAVVAFHKDPQDSPEEHEKAEKRVRENVRGFWILEESTFNKINGGYGFEPTSDNEVAVQNIIIKMVVSRFALYEVKPQQ